MKKMTRFYYLALLLLTLSQSILANPAFGIITAVPDEANYILAHMQNKQEQTVGIYHYTLGSIDNKQTVLLIGGISDTNAAIASSNMIQAFNPNYLIFSGSAGGVNKNLNVGDVIIAKKVYDFDIGDPNGIAPTWPSVLLNPARQQVDPVIYNTSSTLLTASRKSAIAPDLKAHTNTGKETANKIQVGTLAATQHIPNNNLDVLRMQALQADAADMETAAFMKTCWLYQKSCIAFRGISNLIAPFTKENVYTEWNTTNQQLADNNAGAVTVHFIQNF